MEKLMAKLVVTVKETKGSIQTQISGLVNKNMDTSDKANIVYCMLKNLNISMLELLMWWFENGREESDSDASVQD